MGYIFASVSTANGTAVVTLLVITSHEASAPSKLPSCLSFHLDFFFPVCLGTVIAIFSNTLQIVINSILLVLSLAVNFARTMIEVLNCL